MIVKSVVDLDESIVTEHYDSCPTLWQIFIGAHPFNGFSGHVRLSEVEAFEEQLVAAGAHGALKEEWPVDVWKENLISVRKKIQIFVFLYKNKKFH